MYHSIKTFETGMAEGGEKGVGRGPLRKRGFTCGPFDESEHIRTRPDRLYAARVTPLHARSETEPYPSKTKRCDR